MGAAGAEIVTDAEGIVTEMIRNGDARVGGGVPAPGGHEANGLAIVIEIGIGGGAAVHHHGATMAAGETTTAAGERAASPITGLVV